MTIHEYATIDGIQIDKGLERIIRVLWNVGIKTQFSCEEYAPGRAHIIFPSTLDALRFVEYTHEVIDEVGPGIVFSVDMGMYPMPGEFGRWSVEWYTEYTPMVTDVWEGNEITVCDCEECTDDEEYVCEGCS